MSDVESSIRFCAQHEQDTQQLGEIIAANLHGGLFIALTGTLGAGKTRLVQAIAESLGVERTEVTSPTFSLVQVYQGRLPLVHIDAYRIADDDEYLELGIDEMCDDQSVVIMEWAERFTTLLPTDRLSIQIEVQGDSQREFLICWPEKSASTAHVGEFIRQDLKRSDSR
ncbi:MAG: tRNA (adenosine(37)-N6)-threonylcarbamoyltransferase complex ATPase subunit type 1 TsaE [Pirellulaceae bacterium]